MKGEILQNQGSYTEERKEKLRKIKERLLKTRYDAQNNSYENLTPMFRTNA